MYYVTLISLSPFCFQINYSDQLAATTPMSTSTSTVEGIRVAAERGDSNAQTKLGVLLYKGEGVTKDLPAALG